MEDEEVKNLFISNFKKSFRESSRFRDVTKNPKVEAMEKSMQNVFANKYKIPIKNQDGTFDQPAETPLK